MKWVTTGVRVSLTTQINKTYYTNTLCNSRLSYGRNISCSQHHIFKLVSQIKKEKEQKYGLPFGGLWVISEKKIRHIEGKNSCREISGEKPPTVERNISFMACNV